MKKFGKKLIKLYLSCCMVVGLCLSMLGSVYAVDTKTVDTDMMLGKLMVALGQDPSDFTIDNIQKAGIEDYAFAKAVYDSVLDDQDNFKYGIYLKDLDSGEIDQSKKPTIYSTETIIDQGKNAGIISDNPDLLSSIRLILSYFSGYVDGEGEDADNRGNIRSIKGIKILRRAWKINLDYNQIEDISEMEVGNGEICSASATDSEYGYKKYFGSNRRNTFVFLGCNPIKTIFEETDGRIRINLGVGSDTELPSISIVHTVKDNEDNNISISTLAEVLMKGRRIGLTTSGVIFDPWETTVKVNEENLELIKDENDGLKNVVIKNINTSGKLMISMSYATAESGLRIWYAGLRSDSTASNSYGLITYRKINVSMYTSVQVDYESKGSIHLKKKDEQGNPVKDAKFNLYRCTSSGSELVKKDENTSEYTTDENGDIYVSDLDDGNYYFVEVSVPSGHIQKMYGNEFNVKKGESFTVSGADETARYSLYKMSGKKQSAGDKCIVHGLKANNGNVSYTVDEDGTYYLVRNELFTIKNVSKDDITLKNTTRDINAWNGDSLETTDGETTKTETIENGFYVKGMVPYSEDEYGNPMEDTGPDTADKIDFSYKDNETAPLEGITVDWTKSLSESDIEAGKGNVTYVVGTGTDSDNKIYCTDASDLQTKVKEKVQQLSAQEYRNVNVKLNFGMSKENRDSVKTIDITNEKSEEPTTLKVYKQDEDEKMIEGAEFTLYQAADSNDENKETIKVDGQDKEVVRVDRQTTKKENDTQRAVAVFDNLTAGSEYYLAETKLPAGYQYIKRDDGDYEEPQEANKEDRSRSWTLT